MNIKTLSSRIISAEQGRIEKTVGGLNSKVMNNKNRKLELTWIGKDNQPKLEPCIMINVTIGFYTMGKMVKNQSHKKLSLDLIKEFGKGFSERNLENVRKFYLLYSAKISQTVSAKSETVFNIFTEPFCSCFYKMYNK